MNSLSQKDKELLIKINVEDLTSDQVRLIKTLNALIANVVCAETEEEYFEMSARLVRKSTELIKKSNFPTQNKEIPYAEQAVEFAVDFLNESLDQNLNIDN
jgi:hypothetical protein